MPTIAEALAAAVGLHQRGELAAAEPIYRQVLAADPRNFDALHLLGLVLHQTGRGDQGSELLKQALEINPTSPEAHYNLGNMLRETGRPADAAAAYTRAIQLKPHYPEAHYNLGNALMDLRQSAAAIASYRQALEQRPNYLKALNNLGNACLEAGRPAEAAEAYEQALRLRPDYAKGHSNLGNALRQFGRADEAAESCRRALSIEPDNPEALNNLAAALVDLGQIDEARNSFDQAIALRPDYAEAHMNRAMAWLLAGDYVRGWAEYEWRWRSKAFAPRHFSQPTWDGSDPHGRTILIHAEQGLGDTLQFIRYLPRLAERGARVWFGCPAVLHTLLARFPGVERLVRNDESPPGFELHAPLLSLPYLLRLPEPDRAGPVPYLFADERLRQKWRSEIATLEGMNVGINWQGNPQHPKDRQRSFQLSEFAPLAELAGIQLVSLQKGHGQEQLATFPHTSRAIDLGSRLDETAGAFIDTAAVARELDLVITSDTALAHLAGAVGANVWLVLSTTPDWRWGLHGETTPWYPTMRLLRQTTPGDWSGVFRRIAAELQRRLNQPKMV
jgi:tetratricopeptide (TPR) repeat protein